MHLLKEPQPQELPPHQSFDDQIDVKEGKEVAFGFIRHLLGIELRALREYLD
jgi:hypothetical protein